VPLDGVSTAASGFYWPSITAGTGRVAVITTITLALAWLNLRGIRQSAIAINLFTISKLTPLAIFILVSFDHDVRSDCRDGDAARSVALGDPAR
jgi:amino acid transporter